MRGLQLSSIRSELLCISKKIHHIITLSHHSVVGKLEARSRNWTSKVVVNNLDLT